MFLTETYENTLCHLKWHSSTFFPHDIFLTQKRLTGTILIGEGGKGSYRRYYLI